MSDEFWTPEEDAEFAQAELDDAAASQAAEDQFPTGWTDVGVTIEPVLLEDLHGGGTRNEELRKLTKANIVAGPARLYTQPVTSPIFEAIDRASQDRTPVVETTVSPSDSWIRFQKALTDAVASFTETVQGAAKTASSAGDRLDALEQIYGPLTPQRRQVALIGTGKRRHRATRGTRTELGLSRAEHARRRRLYTERLRRDRRRIRKGRAPILRSSTFEAVIPNAQVDVTRAGPEYRGMEIVAAPWVPEDKAYIIDPSVLDGYRFTEPKSFERDPERPRSRFADQVTLYRSTWARYGSPTGRFRTTNYFTQMLADYDAERSGRGGWNGPVVIAIDETANWALEHTPEIDRWLDDGGADHGQS